jgi:hypothetical protein
MWALMSWPKDVKPLANEHELHGATPDGKKIALSVDPTESVSAIKVKLQFREGVLPKEQRLVYNGNLLAERQSLKMQNVPPMAFNNLKQASPVFAMLPDGRTVALDVNPDDTLSSLKKKIKEMTDLPVENQGVLFERHELYDDKSLRNYDTPQDGTLVITDPNNEANPLRSVMAKLADGGQVTVEIDPEDSLYQVAEECLIRAAKNEVDPNLKANQPL